jgi:repressor LexA
MGRTPRGQTRAQVLAFVRTRLQQGQPPTVREVQQQFGFRSVGTAREHLEALLQAGLLQRADAGKHRGMRLPGQPRPTVLVPLLGRVQAGALTEAIAEPAGHVAIATRLPPAELFALRARGDSMAPEILDGDLLIVRRQPVAADGAVVIAMVDGEATVKRLWRRRAGRGEANRIELRATNPAYAPIVPAGPLELLGVVFELRRRLGGDSDGGDAGSDVGSLATQ